MFLITRSAKSLVGEEGYRKYISKREDIHCMLINGYFFSGRPIRNNYGRLFIAMTVTEWQRILT